MRLDPATFRTTLPFLLLLCTAPHLGAQRPGGSDTLSMETPRALRFTTDEGTWMSVDLSPDDRTIVFDLLGDLYTLPLAGGKATRLTSGQGFDAMPRFSPDGRQVVFVSDRSGASNVWIVNVDGTRPRQLTRTERFAYVSPSFTPDGRAVLVSRNNGFRNGGPFDLYVVHLVGSNVQRLTGLTPAPAAPPGPGGGGGQANTHFGARFTDARTVWYSTSGANAQVFSLDLPTGKVIRQTNARAGAVRPIPSPDGRWLVYGTRRNDETALRLRNLESGDERWFVLEAQRDQMSGSPTRDLLPGMAFTRDGSALVATRGGKLWRFAMPTGVATPIPFSADVDVPLGALSQFEYTHEDSTLDVRQIRMPRLSPDGRRLAFVALDRIWIADLPAATGDATPASITGARRLTKHALSEFSPAWSPDGRFIAFTTWHDTVGGDLHRVNVATGDVQNLSNRLGHYDKLAYTPDGSRLLFTYATRAARFETDELGFAGPTQTGADLYAMPANGGVRTLLMRLGHHSGITRAPFYGVPHFGADSGRFVLFDTENRGLFTFRLDGSDRTLVLRANQVPWNSSAEEPAEDIILSPRGDRAAILGMQHLYLAHFLPSVVPPTMTVAGNNANASVPLRRLSRVGATFATWSQDGRHLAYSLGPTLFVHDVARSDSTVAAGGTYEPRRIDVRIRVPKDRPDGAVVLRGARLITMQGTQVVERGDIVVRNNRIVAVGPSGSVAVPAGARTLDMSGKTIMPGFVDAHAHIYATGWGLHHTDLWQLYANLAYGVTAMRDPQTGTTDIIDYADGIETGDLIGPRLYATARGFFDQEELTSLDEARNMLRRNSEFLKTETVKQYLVGDRKRRQWFVQATRELRLSPTNEGGADVMLNLTHMLDGYAGEEHSLPLWPLYNDVVRLAVESGITYTPALIVAYGGPAHQEYFTSRFDMRKEAKLQRFWPQSFMEQRTMQSQWRPDEYYAFPRLAADAARIAAAGGRIGVGSHGNLQGIGFHMEMWALAMGGMPPHEVLRAATVMGAQALGHLRDLGTVEAGKLADLVVLDRNPLEDIRNTNSVSAVMKNGRLYDAATLNEVWPRRRTLPTNQWWMAPERR